MITKNCKLKTFPTEVKVKKTTRFINTIKFFSNVSVCPGFPKDLSPVPQLLPPEFTKHLIEPREYPGAHIRQRDDGPLFLVTGPMCVFKKGDVIVGREENNQFLPIFDSEGNITARNTLLRKTELLTMERVEQLGLLPYITERE